MFQCSECERSGSKSLLGRLVRKGTIIVGIYDTHSSDLLLSNYFHLSCSLLVSGRWKDMTRSSLKVAES